MSPPGTVSSPHLSPFIDGISPMTNSDTTLQDRRDRGRLVLDEMLGPEAAAETVAHWQTICPDFGDYVTEFLAGEIWSRQGLDRRTRSLISIAALASLGRTRALELNLQFAINNGASRRDIVEALLQIAPYAGFPVTWDALARLEQVCPRDDAS